MSWRQWPNANIGVAVPGGMVVLGIAEAVANAKGLARARWRLQ